MNQALAAGVIERALAARTEANRLFFEAEADRLARLCHRMAERFARGGRLIALGRSPAARSDARHVAVEFVHPVIVGKRALPALALTAEGGPLESQVELAVEPDDMAIAFGDCAPALALARERGCLTLGFEGRRGRVGVRAARGGRVDPPGARGDALPRALGARARVLRPPRPARGPCGAAAARPGRLELPVSVPGRAGAGPRGSRGGRAQLGARQGARGGRAARADARRQRRRAAGRGRGPALRSGGGRAAARARQRRLGNRRDGRCRRLPPSAPTRAGRRGARSTSPRTPRSSPRSRTTSGRTRCSRAR